MNNKNISTNTISARRRSSLLAVQGLMNMMESKGNSIGHNMVPGNVPIVPVCSSMPEVQIQMQPQFHNSIGSSMSALQLKEAMLKFQAMKRLEEIQLEKVIAQNTAVYHGLRMDNIRSSSFSSPSNDVHLGVGKAPYFNGVVKPLTRVQEQSRDSSRIQMLNRQVSFPSVGQYKSPIPPLVSNKKHKRAKSLKSVGDYKILVRVSNQNDIILAPGTAYTAYSGNVQFQKIVDSYVKEDLSQNIQGLRSTKLMRNISIKIVKHISEMSPPGRFLREDKESGLWYVATTEDAVTRTNRLLRKRMQTLCKSLSPNRESVLKVTGRVVRKVSDESINSQSAISTNSLSHNEESESKPKNDSSRLDKLLAETWKDEQSVRRLTSTTSHRKESNKRTNSNISLDDPYAPTKKSQGRGLKHLIQKRMKNIPL